MNKNNYFISIEGHIPEETLTDFEGFAFKHITDEQHGALTVISGRINNQEELRNVLHRIKSLGLILVSVQLK